MKNKLFTALEFDFYDDGTADDQILKNRRVIRWALSGLNGTEATHVFWVWDDGTMTLAAESVQLAYRRYIAELILEA